MSRHTAVVFDLDGTLVDSAPDLHVAANRLLAEEGQPSLSLEQVRMMVGEGVGRLVTRLFAAFDIKLSERATTHYTDRFRALYLEQPCHLTKLMPGARACLDALGDEHALAICTNKPLAPTRAILEELAVADRFASVVGGDSLAVLKPDPAPLLRAIGEAGATPATSVFVGDSEIDLKTGAAAGVGAILVAGGYVSRPPTLTANDVHAASLDDVPRLVPERLGR